MKWHQWQTIKKNTNATTWYNWFTYFYIFIKFECQDVQFLLLSLLLSRVLQNQYYSEREFSEQGTLNITGSCRMSGDMNPGTEPTDLSTRIMEHKHFCDTVWRQDHLSMSLACLILAQQVLGYRSQTKRPIHCDIYSNTLLFALSNLCESIPHGYFITGYNIGTTAAELREYSKCFVHLTHRPLTNRTLLAIQLQRDGNAMITRYTQTSHWMWSNEKICTMHCFSTLNIIWVLKTVSLQYSLKSITVHSAINFLIRFIQLVPDFFPHYINSVLSWITRICKSKKHGAPQAPQV
jgi:hypothetical protein